MASKKKVLFGLLVLCLSVYLAECGRFGGGRSSSRSSSRGGSSWGKGWGGSSSGSSWSKPSSSSSWGSSGSSYKPSSSWNTGSSSGSSHWFSSGNSNKPSTSWNTGSSSGSHGYPSGSGLSGSGSGSHSYPSGTGLSGSSGNSYKPSTSWNTGSSSGSHSYPSGSGLSGSGSSRYPSSGSGSHSYPSGSGLSGSGTHYKPSYSNNYPANTNHINTGHGYGTHSYHYVPYTYHSAPQHVYITQYRDSGSRYSDILTGLTLYNMGRSHSHYHDHYYYDDYYRNRYHSSNSNGQSSYNKPNDEATCTLRIKENGKLEVLKIPCEIVSTFTEGGKKIENESQVNHTVCTTNTTVTKTSTATNMTGTAGLPISTTASPRDSTSNTVVNVTARSIQAYMADLLGENLTTEATPNATTIVTSNVTMTSVNPIDTINGTTVAPTVIKINETNGNVTVETVKTQTATEIIVNITTCTTIQNYTDPLSVKGGQFDPSNMECSVDIRTKTSHFRNTVQCKTLMEYSKMPVPKNENKPLLPPRDKLKSWIEKPPWWMSMFIAV